MDSFVLSCEGSLKLEKVKAALKTALESLHSVLEVLDTTDETDVLIVQEYRDNIKLTYTKICQDVASHCQRCEDCGPCGPMTG